MPPFCPRCNYPCHVGLTTCLACGRPLPPPPPALPEPPKPKKPKARHTRARPITRDDDPIAS